MPLPIVGIGTWQTFDIAENDPCRAGLQNILRLLSSNGGRVIDSSPMYGKSEKVVGELLKETKLQNNVFLATKVWTKGKAAGIVQMNNSFEKFQTDRIDLMQIHNLLDWQTHLPVLNDWKSRERIKYTGITHYHESAFAEVESILRKEKFDFLQINYSLQRRKAEERLLPLAMDKGVGVIINQPFDSGSLFSIVRGKELPGFARELDCHSWSEYFLKFILSHPAVTCVIPSSGKAAHMIDNFRAGFGTLPDASIRKKMVNFINE